MSTAARARMFVSTHAAVRDTAGGGSVRACLLVHQPLPGWHFAVGRVCSSTSVAEATAGHAFFRNEGEACSNLRIIRAMVAMA